MARELFFENILRKQSFLCVGLDTNLKKVPQFLLERTAKEKIKVSKHSDIPKAATAKVWRVVNHAECYEMDRILSTPYSHDLACAGLIFLLFTNNF